MVHLITYDLNKTKDYPQLYQAIKGLGDWIRDPDLDSVWFVSTSLDANQTNERLLQHIDQDDRIFVTRLYSGEYAGWLNKELWPWISAQL